MVMHKMAAYFAIKTGYAYIHRDLAMFRRELKRQTCGKDTIRHIAITIICSKSVCLHKCVCSGKIKNE